MGTEWWKSPFWQIKALIAVLFANPIHGSLEFNGSLFFSLLTFWVPICFSGSLLFVFRVNSCKECQFSLHENGFQKLVSLTHDNLLLISPFIKGPWIPESRASPDQDQRVLKFRMLSTRSGPTNRAPILPFRQFKIIALSRYPLESYTQYIVWFDIFNSYKKVVTHQCL